MQLEPNVRRDKWQAINYAPVIVIASGLVNDWYTMTLVEWLEADVEEANATHPSLTGAARHPVTIVDWHQNSSSLQVV